jgi:hypothetical protein
VDFSFFLRKVTRQHSILFWFLTGMVIFGMGTTSCGSSLPILKPAVTATPSVPTLAPSNTLRPTLTVSPTPVIPLALLLAPQGSDARQVKAASAALSNLSAREGVRWELRQTISKADLTPDLRLVIAFLPAPGLEEIIQAAPGVQFLAVGMPGLQASANLSQVSAQGSQPEQTAFMAGILAAMITDEWRVGVISLSDTPEGIAARDAFLNGAVFFCGLCRQLYPPFYKYPMYVEFASGSHPSERQSVVPVLKDRFVKTVYLYPGASDPDLIKQLSDAGIAIIGSAPPGAPLPAQWAATIQADPSTVFEPLLSQLWQGKGGQILTIPMELTDVNPGLVSPGRQLLAEKYLEDIQAGVILPTAYP